MIKTLPNLYALRFIAAAMVVIGHAEQSKGHVGLKSYFTAFPALFQIGPLFVTFFFALSGFIITYIAIHDFSTQNFSIVDFFKKRIARIWPLYYAVVIVGLFIVPNFHYLEYDTEYLRNFNDLDQDSQIKLTWAYLFFVPHVAVFVDVISYLGHTWSIGSEEQFYLVWPFFLTAFHRSLTKWILVFIALLIGLRIIFSFTGPQVAVSFLDISRMHCMLFGAFMASIFTSNSSNHIIVFLGNVLRSKITQVVALIGLFSIIFFMKHVPTVKHDLFGLFSAILIANLALNKDAIFNINGSNLINYLGKISYGIYMYHPLVIGICVHLITKETDLYFSSFKSNLIFHLTILTLTGLVSYVSYEFFERRIIAWMNKRKS